jgi:anti-sigma-K factor RskA
MSDEQHVLDLIPAYALGCLDGGDLAAVKGHLASCESCRQELTTYQDLVDRLPLALSQTSPPPAVKQKLMQVVAKGKTAIPEGKPLTFWQRVTASLQRSSPTWALTSLVIVVLLVASNLLLWRQVNQSKQVQMPLVGLHGTSFAPEASGTIVISRDGEHGALVVDRLKPLGDQQQYQLWLVKDGVHTSGGVFLVDESGYTTLYVESPQPLSSYNSFGVTIEPAGGSQSPTGAKVLVGKL